jgi:hypothetical protein
MDPYMLKYRYTLRRSIHQLQNNCCLWARKDMDRVFEGPSFFSKRKT